MAVSIREKSAGHAAGEGGGVIIGRVLKGVGGALVSVLLAAGASLTPAWAGVREADAPEPAFVVAVDAGHGGTATPDPEQLFDPGALAFGLAEKDVTLDLARRVEAAFGKERIRVFLTRSQDEFLTISERVRRAQAAQADAFISLHINAYEADPTTGGTLVLYPGDRSSSFAEAIHRELAATLQPWKMEHGGTLLKDDLWTKLTIPTVTVEPAYLTNPREAELLKTDAFKDAIATAVVRGLVAAFPDLQRMQGSGALEERGRRVVVTAPPTIMHRAPASSTPLGQRELRSLWPAALLLVGMVFLPRAWRLWKRPRPRAQWPNIPRVPSRPRSIAGTVSPQDRAVTRRK